MILRNATIKYKGYDPEDLKPKSKKRVCVSCDKCGRVRWVSKSDSHHLCKVCGMKGKLVGKNNPNYKSKITLTCQHCGDEYQVKQSKKLISKFCCKKCKDEWKSIHNCGSNHPNWKGGISNLDQPHLISINQCIKLNTKIDGFDAHHIMKGVIIYLPHKLHSINWHDLKNNKNMNKINELALNYLMGEIL